MKTFIPNHPIELRDPLLSWRRILAVTTSFIVALLAGLFGIFAHAAPGDVDPSFDAGSGVNGMVHAIAVAPDGKVLLGGERLVDNLVYAPIARVNANGSPDSSFNPGAGPNFAVKAVALQPDGKLLIGGRFISNNDPINGTDRHAITRLHPDGSRDASFNPTLAELTPFDPPVEGAPEDTVQGYWRSVNAIQVQADGKILVAGYVETTTFAGSVYSITARPFVFRLHANGTHDSSFAAGNGNEVFELPHSPPNSLALQPDGKVLVGGAADYSVTGTGHESLARLTANGIVDFSFFPAAHIIDAELGSRVYGIALQPDGKVLAGGYGVIRFNANGTRDTTFLRGLVSGAYGVVTSVALQSDGKVLVSGSFTGYNGTPRNGIARLNANGSLDTAFNPAPGVGPTIWSMALQSDGNVLIAGDFLTVGGYLRPGLARLLGGPGAPQPPPVPNTPPVVTLLGASSVTIEAGTQYTDPGATATDDMDGSLTPVVTSNTVVSNSPGNYAVTWTAMDSFGAAGSATRMVTVQDTTAPSVGGAFSPVRVKARSPLPDYRPQAVFSDIVGVTSVTQSPPPGTRVTGPTMTVTITARDAANNAGGVSFTVKVTGH